VPILASIVYLIVFKQPNVAECAGSSGEGGSLDGSAVSRWLKGSQPSETSDDAGTSTLAPHPSRVELEMEMAAPEEMENPAPEELENPAPEEPLMTREARIRELTTEFDRRSAAGLTAKLTAAQKSTLIQYQVRIELLLEKELLKRGYGVAVVNSRRITWRNAAFTGGTSSKYLSPQSLQRTLLLYEQNIEQSLNFRRVIQALEWIGCKP